MLLLHQCSNIGDEWLVTDKDTESYIPDVTEVGMAKKKKNLMPMDLTTFAV